MLPRDWHRVRTKKLLYCKTNFLLNNWLVIFKKKKEGKSSGLRALSPTIDCIMKLGQGRKSRFIFSLFSSLFYLVSKKLCSSCLIELLSLIQFSSPFLKKQISSGHRLIIASSLLKEFYILIPLLQLRHL